MARRRTLVLVALVAVAAALLVVNRIAGGDDPGGADAGPTPPGDDQPARPRTPDPAGGPPGAEPARTPAPPGTSGAPTGSPDPARATPPATMPHDHGGVSGQEELNPADADRALAVAGEFAAAWVDAGPGWHDRLAGLATPALADTLADAEPPDPAPVVTGDGLLLYETPQWARIGVPTDRGLLVLDTVDDGGDWRVSAVDWRPA